MHQRDERTAPELPPRGRDLLPRGGVTDPRSAALLRLQRTAGNAAVASALGPVQRVIDGECKDDVEEGEGREGLEVQALRETDAAVVPQVQRAPPTVALPAGPAYAPHAVTPTFIVTRPAPTRSNSAASTTRTFTPTFTGKVAVDAKAKVWRYQLDSVESKGEIQIVYFTDDHYPAPTPLDDSGALSNVTSGNWKDIVKDLKDNRTGIPNFWSAYRAEILHENYHWNVEWQGQIRKHVREAEKRIAALKADFTAAATEADAEALLKPQATTIFDDEMAKARAAYRALGDSPGDPPYVAQAPALDALRARVEAHRRANRWT